MHTYYHAYITFREKSRDFSSVHFGLLNDCVTQLQTSSPYQERFLEEFEGSSYIAISDFGSFVFWESCGKHTPGERSEKYNQFIRFLNETRKELIVSEPTEPGIVDGLEAMELFEKIKRFSRIARGKD